MRMHARAPPLAPTSIARSSAILSLVLRLGLLVVCVLQVVDGGRPCRTGSIHTCMHEHTDMHVSERAWESNRFDSIRVESRHATSHHVKSRHVTSRHAKPRHAYSHQGMCLTGVKSSQVKSSHAKARALRESSQVKSRQAMCLTGVKSSQVTPRHVPYGSGSGRHGGMQESRACMHTHRAM